MPNTDLARKILAAIEEHPDSFDPGTWFTIQTSHAIWPQDPITDDIVMGVAAWACHLSGWYLTRDDMAQSYAYQLDDPDDERHNISVLAVQLLGLDNADLLDEPDRDEAIAGLLAIAGVPEVAPVDEGAQACDCHGAWHAVRDHCRIWPCPGCNTICDVRAPR